ncbi:hypothetical protein LQ327_00850 [Actinomycetospora endophytica]|uniref:UDP-N-acetyl-alpha-D-muramoyl-L-alanyl-L-glutamate epimerase n=1 Tax=Actinomycetospora endophytica TaxID=2291215 RepID=A0ABS8P103_9PSEU|nr:hypothetical protein [Actinomycetospora endophytica]MCD2191937.1 hypothetical protein [Actinomycetospora endophytica]
MAWSRESRWADIHTFRYSGLRFDRASGVAEFDYRHEGSAQQLAFTETVEFPLPGEGVADADLEQFFRVLELLYVAVGTAYYKAIAPRRVVVDTVELAPAAARWAEQLYRDGLAEFAYRWDLEHVLDLPVHCVTRAAADAARSVEENHADPLVAFSGGKDSVVALEVLRAAGFSPATFTVDRRPKPYMGPIAAKLPSRSLRARPRPDPWLQRLAREQAVRSGHAPLTTMTTLVGASVAALHGLGPVVMANERSADEQNLMWRGRQVNHQWAKSTAAEIALEDAIREQAGIASGSFSLLRGMSELEICRVFAALGGYDALFSSCNVVARSNDDDPSWRWCNDCAKCRWVFLAFAPFMTRSRLAGIFGWDLLDDRAQFEGYHELLGLVGHKPFECVGEIAEARVALEQLAEDPEWRDAAVVRELAARLPRVPAEAAAMVRRIDPVSTVPASYQAALDQWAPVTPHGGS